jgi:hypothetical protein
MPPSPSFHDMGFMDVGCCWRDMSMKELEVSRDHEGPERMVVWDACVGGLFRSVDSVSCCT